MTPTNHGGHHYSDAEMHNEDIAHEHSDINIRAVLTFGAGMAVVVVASALLVLIVFRMLERQEAAHDPEISPVAAPAGQEPPSPQLLTNEPANLRKFRAEEANTLDRYGWVHEHAGVTDEQVKAIGHPRVRTLDQASVQAWKQRRQFVEKRRLRTSARA